LKVGQITFPQCFATDGYAMNIGAGGGHDD